MLKRTYDRKVTTATAGKKDLRAKIGNSFGLPAGKAYSCPGATAVCEKVCYAGKLEKIFPGTRKQLLHNWELVRNASPEQTFNMLTVMMDEFVAECDKYNAPKRFRIHWDGDFFSDVYTEEWARVIFLYPDVEFWTYTRVPSAARHLHKANLPNLSLYFSADSENANDAHLLSLTGIKLATMTDTFENGRVMQKDLSGKNGIACPEQKGIVPLIDANGGACHNCGLCITGNNNIRFSTTKR